jgi:hypothetical protein
VPVGNTRNNDVSFGLGRLTSPSLALHAVTHGRAPLGVDIGLRRKVLGVIPSRLLAITRFADAFASGRLVSVPIELFYRPILTALVAPRERSRVGKIADFKAVRGRFS